MSFASTQSTYLPVDSRRCDACSCPGRSSIQAIYQSPCTSCIQGNHAQRYGNRVEIRVSQGDWIEQVLQSIRENRELELVFDDPNITQTAISEIRRRIPPYFHFFAYNLSHRFPELPVRSMEPTTMIVIAIIAAIVVIGLAVIIGIIMLFNTTMAHDISREAMARGYNLCDVQPGGQGSGTGESFNFVNDSRWVIRKEC